MKIGKKICYSLLILLGFVALPTFGQDFYYNYQEWDPGRDNLEIGEIIHEEAVKPQNTVLYKIREMFRLTGKFYDKSNKTVAIDYIKSIINIALGLVGFISLILVLYAFYLMFFTEQEQWMTRAKKILRWVMIALVIMGLSYFIVSFIFYVYNLTSGTGPVSLPVVPPPAK